VIQSTKEEGDTMSRSDLLIECDTFSNGRGLLWGDQIFFLSSVIHSTKEARATMSQSDFLIECDTFNKGSEGYYESIRYFDWVWYVQQKKRAIHVLWVNQIFWSSVIHSIKEEGDTVRQSDFFDRVWYIQQKKRALQWVNQSPIRDVEWGSQ
jgi:hypothetical protein